MEFFLVPSHAVFTTIILGFIWVIVSIKIAKKEYADQAYWTIWNHLVTYGLKIAVIVGMVAITMHSPPIQAAVIALIFSLLLGLVKMIVNDIEDEVGHIHWQHRIHQCIILGLFLGFWYAQVW